MLHTMQVRVVTRQLPNAPQPVVHKAYYFCPSMLSAQGKNVEEYVTTEINNDIAKFKELCPEFHKATFKIETPETVPTFYIS